MRSRKFFGSHKFKDINTAIYNEQGQMIYENHITTFAYVNPILKDVINKAIRDYKDNWEYMGEPDRVEVFTTPNFMECNYHVVDKRKVFISYD